MQEQHFTTNQLGNISDHPSPAGLKELILDLILQDLRHYQLIFCLEEEGYHAIDLHFTNTPLSIAKHLALQK